MSTTQHKSMDSFLFNFQLETSTSTQSTQTNQIPFFIPEKQLRMKAKKKNQIIKDFVFTFYMPCVEVVEIDQQINAPSNSSHKRLFNKYSYRSNEIPSTLQQQSGKSTSTKTDAQSLNICTRVSPPLNLSALPQYKFPRRDIRYSFAYILHNQNAEIDSKVYNPFDDEDNFKKSGCYCLNENGTLHF